MNFDQSRRPSVVDYRGRRQSVVCRGRRCRSAHSRTIHCKDIATPNGNSSWIVTNINGTTP
eukprot:2922416-Pyramimonas_sp.AAC.1